MRQLDSEILSRLDPSPGVDAGHYVERPVPHNGDTLEISEGQMFTETYIISPDSLADGLPFSNIVAEAGSRAEIVILVLPGVSVDVNVAVDIIGRGAEIRVSGLYVCGGEDKVSIRTDIRHRVPECVSYQLFNGIAAGSSKADFFGRIVVAPDAQKTEAYQTNHNLVVSENARAETRPQLEIYADDVKCSHGATVGQLNEDEQFYMRSRGIPEKEARVLQMISFIAPVLSGITDAGLHETLSAKVEEAVRSL
ncbi:MAG: SufD family Fe-S cluster assembly protein [Candidatus Cryptobacteroides sp.]